MGHQDSSVLIDGLGWQEIEADSKQVDLCIRYLELLSKWNKKHNLTAVKNWPDMIRLHILDSLSVLPVLISLANKEKLNSCGFWK